MNRKQLIILVALAVVLGGAGYWLSSKNSTTWKSGESSLGRKLLGELPVNDVAQIVIKKADAELTLGKQNDLWRVKERGNYPANFNEISDFLKKAADLKIVQTEEVGPSQLGRLELIEPGKGGNSGTLVELRDQSGKTLRSLLLGKKHMKKPGAPSQFGGEEGWPDGRYVMNLTGTKDVVVINDPLSSLEPKADAWLNKDFFKVEKPKSVTFTGVSPTNSWKISRENEAGEWKLADIKEGEQMDPAKASALNYLMASAAFNDLVMDAGKTNAPATDAPITARIDTIDGFHYELALARVTGDENYQMKLKVAADITKERPPGKDEKSEDKARLDKEFKDRVQKLEDKLKQEKSLEGWTFLVAKWTVDPLLKERKDFLAEKKEESKKEDAKPDATGIPKLDIK